MKSRLASAKYAVLVALAFSGAGVVAQSVHFSEFNKTVARIGVQGSFYYVGFSEPLSQTCQWGNVYIDADKKAIYTQFLAAKLAGKRLSRVDIGQPGGNGTQCTVELVELSE